MGAGAELIEKAVETGDTDYMAFFWKMLLTALTMKAGFRGGEIVPSFCVGATFGCMAGQLIGLSPPLRSLRNGCCFLWCDELPDYFYSDCL